MTKIHTHYDNMMVARNAPFEVIRASYLALSKKYHPDVNSSQEATRIMKIINNSYDVLSDPEKRRIYDNQVLEAEFRMRNGENNSSCQNNSEAAQRTEKEPNPILRFLNRYPALKKSIIVTLQVISLILRYPRLSFGVIVMGIVWINSFNNPSVSGSRNYVSPRKSEADYVRSKRIEEQRRREAYQKPATAPNGYSWPARSEYLSGYKKLNHKGKSTIQIENFENNDDFYVKLVDCTTNKNVTVRHALIKGGDEFVFSNVSPGKYKLMYMDLESGGLTKSQEFEVQEVIEGNRIRVSAMKITLYKVRNGNFKSEGIDLDEFMDADAVTKNEASPVDFSMENSERVRI